MQTHATIILFIILHCGLCATTLAQVNPPKRKAFIGAIVQTEGNHLKIDSVISGSTCQALGIQKGDVLHKLNDKTLSSLDTYNQLSSQIRAEENVIFDIERGNQSLKKTGKALARPYETNEWADINYDWLPFREGVVRIITKKPKGKVNCPVILFIPGYNCSSVEGYSNNYNGKLINEWLKAGFAVVCPEKSGNGDSYNCLPCIESDLQSDIEIYDKAYQYMLKLDFVDKQNTFIWGHSLGGMIAPVIAEKYQPKGVMVFGTVFRPWNEFLLEMHRIQAPLEGKSYVETESFVRNMHKIYYEFFILKKTPKQLYEIPEYKDLAVSELNYVEGGTQMWGRHWRFWQQIDSLNLAKNWSNVNSQVLSIFGGADFIQCSELEAKLIVETVNKTHPKHAKYLRIENVDHLICTNNSWQESSDNMKDKKYQNEHFNWEMAEKTVAWMRERCKE